MADGLYAATTLTFELSQDQRDRVNAAHAVAREILAAEAARIDASGSLPEAVTRALETCDVRAVDPLTAVLVLEELAAASGAAAAWAGLGEAASGGPLAGLRGVGVVAAPTDRHRLTLAAVCVGIGRAAVHEALAAMKASGDRPAGDPGDRPHWALADAAAAVDGARLVVQAAAAGTGSAAAAQVLAGAAAVTAVDAAVRIVGSQAGRPGCVLERLGRDARAALLIAGTEDEARRIAADSLLSD
jgi:hypothetical protein